MRPQVEAIAVCQHEASETAEPARIAYLLGRAYSIAGDVLSVIAPRTRTDQRLLFKG